MTIARIKETFFRLPKEIKFIGAGALVLAISTFLPWYADMDSYRIGDEFLGITGPSSFVGIVILLLSGLSLWIFSYHLLERKVPRLPVREGIIHLFVAAESLFLLLLVNSIFFHPKFGVNITLKESRFGMTIAVIGAVILLVGAYLKNRDEVAKANESGKLEPLIKMEPTHSESSVETQPLQRPHPILQRSAFGLGGNQPRKIIPQAREGAKGFLFGEAARPKVSPSPAAPKPKTEPMPSTSAEHDKKDQGGGSYMYRMDL